MKELAKNTQFNHLIDSVSKYTKLINVIENFAFGLIGKYPFRIHTERNIQNKNGTTDEFCAYLCIKDENSNGSNWSAFYDKVDIDEWAKKREILKINQP
jgi:hypothetical protein